MLTDGCLCLAGDFPQTTCLLTECCAMIGCFVHFTFPALIPRFTCHCGQSHVVANANTRRWQIRMNQDRSKLTWLTHHTYTRIHLYIPPNPTCSRLYDLERLKADFKRDNPLPPPPVPPRHSANTPPDQHRLQDSQIALGHKRFYL